MTQEPWNEEIYPTRTGSRKERGKKAAISTRIFTFLIAVFILVVIVITAVAIYLSNGGSNTDSTKEFYNTSSSSQAVASQSAQSQTSNADEQGVSQASSAQQTAASSTTTSSVATGDSLTVEAGEGESSIAARAGISIAELERLNPDKMTTGSWFANPGDTVKIK